MNAKARTRLARWTSGAAALAATATLTGPAPASAAEQAWVDGAWVQDTIISCITGQPAPGYTARVSFAGAPDRLPQVGERFYFKVEVGLPGLPCNKTPMVMPELALPHGLEYADDDQHPVRWRMWDVDEGPTGFSTKGLVYEKTYDGILVGLRSDAYPDGGPIEVRQGESFELQVPVRATKVMKGMATREPQCQERIDGDAPCKADESGDHIQVAVSKTDTGPMQKVIPFVGVLVQKAVPTVGAKIAAFSTKAGSATVRLSATTLPTGKVQIFKGTKKIAAGTLTADNEGRVRLKLPRLPKGKQKLTVKYAGSNVVTAAKRTFTVTSR